MNILIVEDDPVSQEYLTALLKPYGTCRVATNGREALTAFQDAWHRNQPFALICMDIMMPEMDGQTALKEIRRLENAMGLEPKKRAIVIMTTALEDAHNVDEALYRGGASSYILKPVNAELLIEDLQRFGLI
ncbi:MAG: Transcriptional activator protein CzcR [Deltaproteobacteria bacterium ADurb.Bin510]|nr:MAG: Transcriptional activator protein CzcR [Deltaproteobacteria bacterium ADurb.Bin510]